MSEAVLKLELLGGGRAGAKGHRKACSMPEALLLFSNDRRAWKPLVCIEASCSAGTSQFSGLTADGSTRTCFLGAQACRAERRAGERGRAWSSLVSG